MPNLQLGITPGSAALKGVSSSPPPAFTPSAIHSDGTPMYEMAPGSLTDSPYVFVSVWARTSTPQPTTANGNTWWHIGAGSNIYLDEAAFYCQIFNMLMTPNALALNADESASALIWEGGQDGSLTPTDGAWHNIMYSVDVSADPGVFRLFIDNVEFTIPGYPPIFNGALPWNMNWSAKTLYVNPPLGDMSEIYINTLDYMDIGDPLLRAQFVNASNKPVYLGASGELPSGSPPSVYLKCDYATFGTNSGLGDNFTRYTGDPSTPVTNQPVGPGA